MSNGSCLKMLPLLHKRSQLSGAKKVRSDNGLRGIAIVATSFINLNKYSRYRKNFSDLSGNSGNKVKFVCIGHRNNKKSYCRLALAASVNKATHFFSHEISLVMRSTSALFAESSAVISRDQNHA